MNILTSLGKPEYIFRPSQILLRLSREIGKVNEFEEVELPWGLLIKIRPAETIGSCIWRVGIYDLCVSESLWRLLEPGETALDIGANIGHMTSVMALRAGSHGKVIALEPHPEIFAEFTKNVSCWREIAGLARIDLFEQAASEQVGRASLHLPEFFEGNRGTASLNATTAPSLRTCEVNLNTLDQLVPGGTKIGVMKIDVEGHELAVLKGGKRLLEAGGVRDIVFEEHGALPTPVTQWLEHHGYKVFYLDTGFWRPEMTSIESEKRTHSRKDAPNLLATLAPRRAKERLAARGWQVLGKRKTPAST